MRVLSSEWLQLRSKPVACWRADHGYFTVLTVAINSSPDGRRAQNTGGIGLVFISYRPAGLSASAKKLCREPPSYMEWLSISRHGECCCMLNWCFDGGSCARHERTAVFHRYTYRVCTRQWAHGQASASSSALGVNDCSREPLSARHDEFR